MQQTSHLNSHSNFSASFPQHEERAVTTLQRTFRVIIDCLDTINELFKSAVLHFIRPTILGDSNLRVRKTEVLASLRAMGGEWVNLRSPEGYLLEGMYIKGICESQNPKKTVLLFTGSHQPFEHTADPMVQAYREHGYNVLCLNYAGFGDSQGPINEATLKSTAETAYQYISKTYPDHEISAHGYSLGSFAATYLAKNYPLKKVVIDRGFSSMANNAHDHALRHYGAIAGQIVKILVSYACPLNNLNNIENISGDILYAKANQDQIMHSYHQDLFRQHNPQATFMSFDGIHHHSTDSVWFEDNTAFWNWMERAPIPNSRS